MDDEDEFPTESTDPLSSAGVRINALNGWTIIVRTDPGTGLTTLDSENPEGELVGSRVLGTEDLQLLSEALTAAADQARASDVPVVVDVSRVLGRD